MDMAIGSHVRSDCAEVFVTEAIRWTAVISMLVLLGINFEKSRFRESHFGNKTTEPDIGPRVHHSIRVTISDVLDLHALATRKETAFVVENCRFCAAIWHRWNTAATRSGIAAPTFDHESEDPRTMTTNGRYD
jgi:hypothetical protein